MNVIKVIIILKSQCRVLQKKVCYSDNDKSV